MASYRPSGPGLEETEAREWSDTLRVKELVDEELDFGTQPPPSCIPSIPSICLFLDCILHNKTVIVNTVLFVLSIIEPEVRS